VNGAYFSALEQQVGRKAETLRQAPRVPGTALRGWFTASLFAVGAVMAFLGERRRPLGDRLLVLAILAPLAASGLGYFEVRQMGQRDKAVRMAVLDVMNLRKINKDAIHLEAPIIAVVTGLWRTIATGLAAAVLVPLLGLGRRSGDRLSGT